MLKIASLIHKIRKKRTSMRSGSRRTWRKPKTMWPSLQNAWSQPSSEPKSLKQSSLSKLREELRSASLRIDRLSRAEAQLRNELAATQIQTKQLAGSLTDSTVLRVRLDEITEHRDKLQREVLIEHERRVKDQRLYDENQALSLRVQELEEVLEQANAMLEQFQNFNPAHAETLTQLHVLRRENLTLQAEADCSRSGGRRLQLCLLYQILSAAVERSALPTPLGGGLGEPHISSSYGESAPSPFPSRHDQRKKEDLYSHALSLL